MVGTHRRSRQARRFTFAALSLVVLLAVALALAPARRPGRRVGPPASGSMRSLKPLGGSPSPAFASARELDDARRAAGRFLAGYLPLLYGRGSLHSVEELTRALRRQLLRAHALVTPAEHGRHPRVLSLAAGPIRPGVVLATALIADGGVTTYALRMNLRRGSTGWLVSGVAGG